MLDNWSTHIPVLLEVLNKFPNSKFLELGTGYSSTEQIVSKSDFSIHLETNLNWYNNMKKFEKESHTIQHFQDFTTYEWNCQYFEDEWDICFIDNAPGRSRQSNLIKLKDKCKLIICHDTEEILNNSFNYGWDFSEFKYIFTYTRYPVTTTVCSDHSSITEEYFNSIIKNLLNF